MTERVPTEPDASPPDITVVRGDPTPVELAATTAVISALDEELAATALRAAPPVRSAWERSQVSVRGAHPGPGNWRGFSG